MRYRLSNEAAAPEHLLRPARYDHTLADVAAADKGGAAAVLRDFVEGIQPGQLENLLAATARGAGYGHEFAASTYDDDLDEDDEPFEGVLITARFRPDDVVLSRRGYEQLVAALADRAQSRPPA